MNSIISKLRSFCWLVAAVFVLNLSATAGAQTVVRVDGTAGSSNPANHGSNWGSDAYKYLQDAIAYAALHLPAEIWVAAGTYKPDEDSAHPTGTSNPVNRDKTFLLHNNVGIYGGFHGDEPAQGGFNMRDIHTNITILSGEIGNQSIITDNSYHVVTAVGVRSFDVDGFTIARG